MSSLKHFDTEQLPEHMTYAARLRTAAAKAISEMDMQEIIQEAVKEAKAGNDKARRFLFDAVLGAGQLVHLTQVNHYHDAADAAEVEANGKNKIRPAKAPPLGKLPSPSPLNNEQRQLDANLVRLIQTRGPTYIAVAANELGVPPKEVRNAAKASTELSVDGDFVKMRG